MLREVQIYCRSTYNSYKLNWRPHASSWWLLLAVTDSGTQYVAVDRGWRYTRASGRVYEFYYRQPDHGSVFSGTRIVVYTV